MKLTTTIFLTLALIFSVVESKAQSKGQEFKGTITYQITYPDMNIDAAQMKTMPQTMVLKVNGSRSRADITMSGIDQIMLMDSEAKTTTILLTLNGEKLALKPNKTKGPSGKEPIVEPANESKDIAGFVCKKANIHFGDDRTKANPIEVYYSEEVGSNKLFYDNEYRNLNGIPLQFRYKMQGMNMLLTAVKVEKGKVSNKEFEVPSGYKETTPEQLRQMFGGGI